MPSRSLLATSSAAKRLRDVDQGGALLGHDEAGLDDQERGIADEGGAPGGFLVLCTVVG